MCAKQIAKPAERARDYLAPKVFALIDKTQNEIAMIHSIGYLWGLHHVRARVVEHFNKRLRELAAEANRHWGADEIDRVLAQLHVGNIQDAEQVVQYGIPRGWYARKAKTKNT